MALSSECVHLLLQGLYVKTLTLKLMILEGRALGKADGLEGCALAWGTSVLYKMHSAPTNRISVLVKETQKKSLPIMCPHSKSKASFFVPGNCLLLDDLPAPTSQSSKFRAVTDLWVPFTHCPVTGNVFQQPRETRMVWERGVTAERVR